MREDFDTPQYPGHPGGHGRGRHGLGPEGRSSASEARPGDNVEGMERLGRRSGRGHRGGHGGRPHVGKGDVRAAILLLLGEEPLHGYQLIQHIEERSGGVWRPSPGSVYPALQLLEDEGLIRPEQEEGRRVYHLTDAGKARVAEQRMELEAMRDAVTGRFNPKAQDLRDLVRQLTVAANQVSRVGTPAQLDAAQEALIATRRQLYRILADDVPAAEQPAAGSQRDSDTHV